MYQATLQECFQRTSNDYGKSAWKNSSEELKKVCQKRSKNLNKRECKKQKLTKFKITLEK